MFRLASQNFRSSCMNANRGTSAFREATGIVSGPKQVGRAVVDISTMSVIGRFRSMNKSLPFYIKPNSSIAKIHSRILVRAFSSHNSDPNKQDDPNTKPASSKMGMLATLGMGVSLLAGKTKYVLVALKLTKAAPLASMVLTSFAYSFFFGWPYAVGMVGLIFAHECGHAIVMKQYNVPFSPMVFVPFMGAVIAMKEEPRNAYEEAMIAFGGPVLGSVAALGMGAAGAATDSQLLIALADFGYMINLFNLLPIGSMDGGRIGDAVSPYFGVAGLAAGGALIYTSSIMNPIFYLVMLGGTYTTSMRLLGWDERDNKDYYNIPRSKQAYILSGYVGLICALMYAMGENNKNRKTPKQLAAERDNVVFEEVEDPWAVGGRKEDGVYDDYFSGK